MKLTCILDSGAFTLYNSGKAINLDEYCSYILANQDWITTYIALDVINPDDPEVAAEQGFKNWQYMRSRGLKDAMPVFHIREKIDWLMRYLDAGCEYVGISASSIRGSVATSNWYELVWKHLVSAEGWPVVKTHAFGEGTLSNLSRFPWYSADSASWIYRSQRNAIIDVLGTHLTLRKDGLVSALARDIRDLDKVEMGALQAELDRLKINVTALEERGNMKSYMLLTYLAALHYLHRAQTAQTFCPIRFRQRDFMSKCSRREGFPIPQLNFHFVVGNNPVARAVLAYMGYPRILISYAHVGLSRQDIRAYINDPLAFCQNDKTTNQYLKLLKEIVL